MLHFTATSITTWYILLQYPPQHVSLYCKIHHNLVHFNAISQHASFTTVPITACFILLQHASFYCNIHHNMVHFTAISITTCFILLQFQSQQASFYCNMLNFTAISITTWFILLQYPPQHASLSCKIHNLVHFTTISQHASFYYSTNHSMLHFTTVPITACFNLLQHQARHVSFYFAHLARRLHSHHQLSYVGISQRTFYMFH